LGTLYVSTLPASGLDDWPLRAQRRLPQVSLVVAASSCAAQEALRGLPSTPPLVGLAGTRAALEALETGDVLLLLDGARAAPPGPAVALVRAAAEQGFAVESVPGPSLPVTALVVSGLPADGFHYLGKLPPEPAARSALLASVAAQTRTLVLTTDGPEPGLWEALYGALGARPAVLSSGAGAAHAPPWRGTLGPAAEGPDLPPGPCALVIGGAPERPARWTDDRLGAEIQACLQQGLSANQAARQLAQQSGWPRREIYRRAVHGDPLPQEESKHDRV